jgi:hypothetical protein
MLPQCLFRLKVFYPLHEEALPGFSVLLENEGGEGQISEEKKWPVIASGSKAM